MLKIVIIVDHEEDEYQVDSLLEAIDQSEAKVESVYTQPIDPSIDGVMFDHE